DKQSVIPFKWEKEPGIPKELESLPLKIVPPAKLKPKHVTKHVSTKSCYLVKPIWLRSSKAKKDDEDEEEEAFEENDIFPSHRVSKFSSGSSTASSKGTVLKSSRVAKFAKRIFKRISLSKL
ncbi:hypothetical protein A2U01_0030599, partial [Trifolium medium]|nr:hypothetical protein [Trifolium medium]